MKLFLKILIIIFSIPICFSHARSGGVTSNGGDGIVSEFFDIARSLHNSFVINNTNKINIKLFANTIKNANIYSQPRTYLNNREVGAINIPSRQQIIISQSHWYSLSNKPKLKYVLVLHEFLGLMGYDDRTFSISNELINGPGIEINRVSCPFILNSSVKNSKYYTLEIIEYSVQNYREFRSVVYFNGLPDGNSETISASKMRTKNQTSNIQFEIGTVGSAKLESNNFLSGGTIINFEVWPGSPSYGVSFINLEPVEKIAFNCRNTH